MTVLWAILSKWHLPLWGYLVGTALIAAPVALHVHDAHQRALGAAEAEARSADSLLAVAQHQTDSVSKILRVDTVTLTQTVLRYREIRDTLLVRLRDTIDVHDTVTVRQFIRVADSTIGACRQSLADCLGTNVGLQQQIAAWKLKTHAVQAEPSSRLQRFVGKVGWGLAGLGAGYLLGHGMK